jgi:hypothetical protein
MTGSRENAFVSRTLAVAITSTRRGQEAKLVSPNIFETEAATVTMAWDISLRYQIYQTL